MCSSVPIDHKDGHGHTTTAEYRSVCNRYNLLHPYTPPSLPPPSTCPGAWLKNATTGHWPQWEQWGRTWAARNIIISPSIKIRRITPEMHLPRPQALPPKHFWWKKHHLNKEKPVYNLSFENIVSPGHSVYSVFTVTQHPLLWQSSKEFTSYGNSSLMTQTQQHKMHKNF